MLYKVLWGRELDKIDRRIQNPQTTDADKELLWQKRNDLFDHGLPKDVLDRARNLPTTANGSGCHSVAARHDFDRALPGYPPK
jgi:hypothetical protein